MKNSKVAVFFFVCQIKFSCLRSKTLLEIDFKLWLNYPKKKKKMKILLVLIVLIWLVEGFTVKNVSVLNYEISERPLVLIKFQIDDGDLDLTPANVCAVSF